VKDFKKKRKLERKRVRHWILLQTQDATKKRKERRKKDEKQ